MKNLLIYSTAGKYFTAKKALSDHWSALAIATASGNTRRIDGQYANKSRVPCLVIRFSGRGSLNKRIIAARLAFCDVGDVTMSMISIHCPFDEIGTFRFAKGTMAAWIVPEELVVDYLRAMNQHNLNLIELEGAADEWRSK